MNSPTAADALDGKVDLVRRSAIDLAALAQRDKPYAVHGTAGAAVVRDPLSAAELDYIRFDAQMLQHAECFAWDDKTGQMVRESAISFPTDIPFSRAWLYTPSGIWWFGRDSRLLSLQSAEADPTGGEMRRRCCALSFWAQKDNPENIVLWGYSYDHNEPSSGPIATTNVLLKGGETLADLMAYWDEQWKTGRAVIEALTTKAAQGLGVRIEDLVTVPAELLKAAIKAGHISRDDYQRALTWLDRLVWIRSAEKLTKIFLAGSLWIQQRVLVTSSGHTTRAANRRAERLRVEPKVNVVELRRRDYVRPPGTEGHTEVEWSCSWIVRGHWRQQACGPGMSERKILWIDPFVKGDPDKPFKGGERVFVVRR